MNVKRLSNSRISTIDGNEERKKEKTRRLKRKRSGWSKATEEKHYNQLNAHIERFNRQRTLIKTNKPSIEKSEEKKWKYEKQIESSIRNCNTLVQFVIQIDFNWLSFFFARSFFNEFLRNSIFKLNWIQLEKYLPMFGRK